ncbi:RbsD/FucU family protein [Cellulomonas hominis]
MLVNINPLLTGELLKRLDEMGHSDHLVIADANFPAHRIDPHALEFPGVDIVAMTRAVCEVFPLDADNPPVLMDSGAAEAPPVHTELIQATGSTERTLVDRWAYYDLAASASLIISTGELRLWANVVLYKGIPYSRP